MSCEPRPSIWTLSFTSQSVCIVINSPLQLESSLIFTELLQVQPDVPCLDLSAQNLYILSRGCLVVLNPSYISLKYFNSPERDVISTLYLQQYNSFCGQVSPLLQLCTVLIFVVQGLKLQNMKQNASCLICFISVHLSIHKPTLSYIRDYLRYQPLHQVFLPIQINPLNAELNPIRHLLALVGAHHFVHFSRIRVNPLNTKLPCSNITTIAYRATTNKSHCFYQFINFNQLLVLTITFCRNYNCV